MKATVANRAPDHLKGQLRQAVDELILFDNTAEGRGPRLIAHFVKGKIVKLSRSIPEWAQRSFGKEFTKWLAQERPSPERAAVDPSNRPTMPGT